MSFSSDIKAYAKKTNQKAASVANAVKLKLFTGIILDTRVDTGRLRGNWQTSTGYPKYGVIDRDDKSGSAAVQEAISNVTTNGVDYMTNSLPYAEVWEEKDGMVAKNITRIERNLKEAVASA
jgi:hypothetical protein